MLGTNSKFEAIFWIKGQYQVEIGDYFVIFAKQASLNNRVATATVESQVNKNWIFRCPMNRY